MTITDRLKKATGSDLCGNVIFWISFCILGQPSAVILYYHDWVLGTGQAGCTTCLSPQGRCRLTEPAGRPGRAVGFC